jgi:hypothetical protein
MKRNPEPQGETEGDASLYVARRQPIAFTPCMDRHYGGVALGGGDGSAMKSGQVAARRGVVSLSLRLQPAERVLMIGRFEICCGQVASAAAQTLILDLLA